MDIRNHSIDYFKVLAAFLVVVGHTQPFHYFDGGDIYKYFHILIDQSIRFIIPFFCVISGYFWGKSIRSGASIDHVFWKYSVRLFSIFFFWCLVYLFLPSPSAIHQHGPIALLKKPYWRLIYFLDDPVNLLLNGTKGHLWFLSSLICSIGLCTVLLRFNLKSLLFPVSLILYLFGVLAGSYAPTPIGIVVDFNMKRTLLFTTLPFVIGWQLSSNQNKFTLKVATIVCLIGFLLHWFEVYILWHYYNIYPDKNEYLFGTILYGTGVALISLSCNFKEYDLLTVAGLYTLGIYTGHMVWVSLIREIVHIHNSYAWELLFPVIAYTLTSLMVLFFSRSAVLHRFVK